MVHINARYFHFYYAGFALICACFLLKFTLLPMFAATTEDQAKEVLVGRADFIRAYAASLISRSSQPQAVYDTPQFVAMFNAHAHEVITLPEHEPWNYGWAYPPTYFLAIHALSLLPLKPAFLLWLGLQTALLLAVSYRYVWHRPEDALLLLSPVMLLCLSWGQNGALMAALLIAAFRVMQRRPFLAGCLFACTVFKPQLGVLVPLYLWMQGYYRTLGAMLLFALVLVLLSWGIYGSEAWVAYLHSVAGGFSPHHRSDHASLGILAATASLHMPTFYSMGMWLTGEKSVSLLLQVAATAFGLYRLVTLRAEGLLAMTQVSLLTLVSVPYFGMYDYVWAVVCVQGIALAPKPYNVSPGGFALMMLFVAWALLDLPVATKPLLTLSPLLALAVSEYLRKMKVDENRSLYENMSCV